MRKSHAFDPKQVNIERCRVDLMYAVLVSPDIELTESKSLIDVLLGETMRICAKKYGADYAGTRMISQANAFLRSAAADTRVAKTAYFLFVLSYEHELQELIRRSFDTASPYSPWGASSFAHFAWFMEQLRGMVTATRQWHCNEYNIQESLEKMTQAARSAYVLKIA